MSNLATLGSLVPARVKAILDGMAVRTIITRYEHEAAHAEALKMNAAWSAKVGKVIRPIPHRDSVYYITSENNPCQASQSQAPTLDGKRKVTSGGPVDRTAHLSYQVAYQAERKAKGYGVKFPSGRVVVYPTRVRADKARKVVKGVIAGRS